MKTVAREVRLPVRGARVHFAIAMALISLLPVLTLVYLYINNAGMDSSLNVREWCIASLGIGCSIFLGYVVQSRYPRAIIKLRAYLERIAQGELPDKIHLIRGEDDVLAIETCMHLVINQLKQKLEEREAVLSSIYASAPIMIALIDKDARFRMINAAGVKLLGQPAVNIVGLRAGAALRCVQQLHNPKGCGFGSACHTCPIRQTVLRTLSTGEPQHQVEAMMRIEKDGEEIEVDFLLSTVSVTIGDEQVVLATFLDITERKQAEEERKQLQAQLLQAQKLEALGTLAGGVAHEINNPIMGIMNYAQLIVDRLGPDSPVAEFATEIGHETERVATIVKNLLGFARQDDVGRSPERLCDIVEGTLSLIGALLRHDQIALAVEVPEDLPKIQCRGQQIRQVIMNLLTNARDALNEKYPGYDDDKKIIISARAISDIG